MSLNFLAMRRIFSIVAAGGALMTVAPASAADRLIDACEVAVNVHAEHVELQFPDAVRTGLNVRLAIEFESEGAIYSGEAQCAFRETADDEPPSLRSLQAMGRTNAAMFLVSHHAVWEHFAGGVREASAPELEFHKEPEEERRSRRSVIASR